MQFSVAVAIVFFYFVSFFSYIFSISHIVYAEKPQPTSHMHLMVFELNRFFCVLFSSKRDFIAHTHLNDVVATGFIGILDEWMTFF